MKLYYAPGTCALAPHIVAQEANLPLDLAKVDMATKLLPDGSDFRAVHPLGYVPALQADGGLVLTEVAAIVQYLGDLAPQSGLVPAAGTNERYILQQWLNFVATEVHKGFTPLFNKATVPETREAVTATLSGRLRYLDGLLTGKDFLLFDRFTAADAYLFTVLRWTAFVGIDLGQWPALDRYVSQLRLRPSIVAAMQAQQIKR
jgi:glutathione S-transferase